MKSKLLQQLVASQLSCFVVSLGLSLLIGVLPSVATKPVLDWHLTLGILVVAAPAHIGAILIAYDPLIDPWLAPQKLHVFIEC